MCKKRILCPNRLCKYSQLDHGQTKCDACNTKLLNFRVQLIHDSPKRGFRNKRKRNFVL